MNRANLIYFIAILGVLFSGCKSEPIQQSSGEEDFRVNVRLKEDPNRINPIFANTSAVSREVFPYIFLPLGEFNPETLELSPIIATTVPVEEIITDGPYKDGQRITFEILPDAVWDDGQPITADDFIFTLKTILHPGINADAYRSYYQRVTEANILSTDKKKFEVIFSKYYSSALEAVISLEFVPAHLYDPQQILTSIPYSTFQDTAALAQLTAQDTAFTAFAEKYNSRSYHVSLSQGTGPYKLEKWETDQYILLKRKENYWGKAYPDRPQLRAYPNEILFQIIPDEVTAITLLKDGAIDVMPVKLAENFINLEKDESIQSKFSFHTPQLPSYYYLALNNQSTYLSDPNVRKAIAHIIDVPSLISTQDNGQGKRTSSIIPAFRPEYNTKLPLINYNIEKAKAYLTKSGWSDTDGDQIVDKVIDGIKTDLKISFFSFKSTLSQRMGLLTKEGAKKIGIDIDLIQKKSYKSHWSNKDYDIMPMKASFSLAEYEPYNKYHSDNAKVNGPNGVGYTNTQVDQIIEELQSETDPKTRKELYLKLQEVMYQDQPMVLLYSPVDRIITSKRVEPLISVKKPGYFVNAFKLSSKYAFSEN